MSDLLVAKVGSQVLTDGDRLDESAVRRVVEDIAECRQKGTAVVLVSSGAVAAGRGELGHSMSGASEVERRQVLSAVGQAVLMSAYRRAFESVGLSCAQVLATKSDFRDRDHYLNMQRCISALLAQGVVPVVNENDSVAVTELMFTDNDELAGLVASMMDAKDLVLLTSVDGVLVGNPPQVLPAWTGQIQALTRMSKTSTGRGGVHTKIRVALQAADLGINCWIANGTRPQVLSEIQSGQAVGTRFSGSRRVSQVKRWVATSAGHERGVVTINAGAAAALRDPGHLTSLLPVGVVSIEGQFERGDILRVQETSGDLVGYGKAQYGFVAADRHIGQQGARPLIHYDYLYVESRC